MRSLVCSCVVVLLGSAPIAAQSEWLAAEGTSVALEYRHASLGDINPDLDLSPLNGAFFLSGRFVMPVTGAALLAEIPYGYFSAGGEDDGSGSLLGNIYIGGELPILLGLATVEAGVRLPTAGEVDPDHAAVLAFTSTFPDRYDAFGGMHFLQRVLTPRVGIRAGVPGVPIFDVEANASLAYMMREDTEIPAFDDDLMLDGGVRAFANLLGARAGLGLEGAIELTGEAEGDFLEAEAEDFGERSMFQAGVWLDYDLGLFRPGVAFFVPLNDNTSFVYPQQESESSGVDWMLGLSLEADLPF